MSIYINECGDKVIKLEVMSGTGRDDKFYVDESEHRISVMTFGGDDFIDATANNLTHNQIHSFGASGNDTTIMRFSDITDFSHGHHVRGGTGNDIFDFKDIHEVSSTVVGRIEDLESGDIVRIEGVTLNLTDPNSWPDNVRVVAFDGDASDINTETQPWLLIETSAGGHIFYALEGARYDSAGNGRANNGWQEAHFISATDLPSDFNRLPDWGPLVFDITYVPEGMSVNGGDVIDDFDDNQGALAPILGTALSDLISAGLNDDDVYAGSGNDRVWGGGGNDTINGDDGNDTILGGTGNDSITGGKGDDRLYGENGNDVLNGWGGNDLQYGGNGHDKLYGQQGDDTLYGNAGFDRLEGGTGNDLLDGGDQADNLLGGQGNDTLLGGNGFDRLFGQEGDDLLYGGNTFDSLYGQEDNDRMFGQSGNDNLWGGQGNDFLDGGGDNDRMIGGAGFDTLLGSTGNDTMIGAFNADTFIFTDFGGGFGQDIIEDFDANNDFEKIDLSRVSGITDFNDLVNGGHMATSGANVVINDGSGNTITLLNASIADLLDGNDFIF